MTNAPAQVPGPDRSEIDSPPVIGARRPWRKPGWLWLGVAALFAVIGVLLYCFNPGQYSFYPFCVFYRVTGWECPGCGGLRAAHQLLHGHIGTAFKFNPLVVTAAPLLLAWAVHRWLRGPGEPVSHRAMARRAWLAFCILVVFWIVRNLPIDFFKLPGE